MKLLIICSLLTVSVTKVLANDFSSFLSANASLAVVIDDDYMRKQNIEIISQVQKIVDDVVRENLVVGGLNVRYFTWASVRLKKDFVAAITVTDCQRTWKFYENADQSSIMLLAITEADCPRLPPNQAVMIPIIDRGEETPQLLLDIKVQKLLNWKSCVLLFDSSVESKSTQIVASLTLDSFKNMFKPVAVYLYKIEETLRYQQKREAIKDALSKFINMRMNRFVVFSSSVEEVMEIATNFKMFNVFNQWLFFLPNTTDRLNVVNLTQGLNEGVNLAFAVNDTIVGCQETILCSFSELILAFVRALSSIIKEEGALYGQISDEEWEAIRLTKKERQTEILAYIKKYLKESSRCSGCSKWSFKSVESWGKSRRYAQNMQKLEGERKAYYDFVDVGYWSPMFGFIAKDVLFPHTDHKFRNITLNVITYNNPPWQIITRDERGEIVESSGIVIEILKELSDKLNFTYKLYELRTDDNTIGVNENASIVDLAGTLTNNVPPKLLEMLVEKNFFLAAVAATIDTRNFRSFNYTIPISVQMYTFISKRPDEVNRIYLFTAPFTITTWACLVAIIVMIAPVLYLVNKFGPLDTQRSNGLCKMKNCFWYIYGALLQQGGMYLPKADSGRVIIGVWWIVVIVLVTTYCGNLVAFLTFPRFQPGINYLFETFLHKHVTTFGLRNGTYFEKYAMHSTRKDFKKFMDKVTLYGNSTGEQIEAVQKGERINVDWKINLQLKMQNQFEIKKECNFILGKEDFVDEQIGLMLPSGSPYLELINDEIKRLHQMGFMKRWHQKFLPTIDKCNTQGLTRQITNHMVNINDIQGCFLVLLLGFLFSAFIIILEFWVHRLQLINFKKFKMFAN